MTLCKLFHDIFTTNECVYHTPTNNFVLFILYNFVLFILYNHTTSLWFMGVDEKSMIVEGVVGNLEFNFF